MKPSSISYSNVKSKSGHYALNSVNMTTGPNGAGKSAFLSAVKIELWGHDMEFGKQHKATFQLAAESSPEMEVAMTIGENSFSRTWKRKGEGDIKYSESGDTIELPLILMDMDEFLGPKKTEQDRINYVFERTEEKDLAFSDDDLLARIEKLEAVPVKPAEAARATLLAGIRKSIEARKRDKIKLQIWIEKLLDYIKEQKKDSDGVIKQMGATMQPLKPTGRPLADRSEELAGKKKELDAIDDLLVKMRRAAEIRATLETPVVDDSADKEELAKLTTEINAYKSESKSLSDKIVKLREQAKGVNSEKLRLTAEATKIEQYLAQHKCSNPGCPFGQSYEADRTNLTEQAAAKAEEFSKMVKKGEALKKDLAVAEANDAAQAKKVARRNNLSERVSSQNAVSADRRKTLQDELAAITTLPGMEKSLADATGMQSALSLEVVALSKHQEAFNLERANAETMKNIEQTILNKTAETAILKLAIDEISDLQQLTLEKAFDPLLVRARPFTDGLLPANLEYRSGSLGMTTPAGWVPLKVFSDSQRAIAFAGIAVALAQSSPFKVVFMDEMGKFEFEPNNRKHLVIRRMCDLVRQGVIHAFFGADNRTSDYLSLQDPEFNHIILS